MENKSNLRFGLIDKCLSIGKRITFVKEMHSKLRKCMFNAWYNDLNDTDNMPPSKEFDDKMESVEREVEKTNVNLQKVEKDLVDLLTLLLTKSLEEFEKFILNV